MAFTTEYRRAKVAVSVALSGQTGRAGRLFRIRVFFPDVGPATVVSMGYLRYVGEPRFVPGDQTEAVTSARSNHSL